MALVKHTFILVIQVIQVIQCNFGRKKVCRNFFTKKTVPHVFLHVVHTIQKEKSIKR